MQDNLENFEQVESWQDIFFERLKFLLTITMCLLIDAVFVCFWILEHWLLHYVIEYFNLHGIEEWIGFVIRMLLEIPVISTLIIFIGTDICKIGKRLIFGSRHSTLPKNLMADQSLLLTKDEADKRTTSMNLEVTKIRKKASKQLKIVERKNKEAKNNE